MLTGTVIWGWVFVIVGFFFGFMALKTKHIVPNVSSIATQIITVENYGYEFQKKENCIVLRLHPEIHASPGVRVEDIQLEMRGKRYETDWEPMKESISGDIGHYVYANLPTSLKSGTYQARLVAVIQNDEYYSEAFDLEYGKPS